MQGLGFSRYYGLVSSAYSVYRLKSEFVGNWRYFHYLLRSAIYKWELQIRSKGVWLSRLQLSDTAFLDMPIIVPSAEDAAAIVRYLDHVDRRIRRYIRTKQTLIKLLNEQKQIIIQQAVTSGLHPDAPRKDSGVEWLGEVPAHWEVIVVRRLISFITSGSRGWAEFYSDEGDIFIQSGNLGRSMALNLQRIQYVRTPPGTEGERTRVSKNDILVCVTGALTGNVVCVDTDLPPAYINQHVALLRPKTMLIFPRFLAYALYSPYGQVQFKLTEYGGTKQGLGLDDVRDVIVALPSLNEQIRITVALDDELRNLTNTIQRIEGEISLIREYRTRLIADVVTGKLDVRTVAAQLPDEIDEPDVVEEIDEMTESDDDLAELSEEMSEE